MDVLTTPWDLYATLRDLLGDADAFGHEDAAMARAQAVDPSPITRQRRPQVQAEGRWRILR